MNPRLHWFGSDEPWLFDYNTAEPIRPATANEIRDSRNSYTGAIVVDGRKAYVL